MYVFLLDSPVNGIGTASISGSLLETDGKHDRSKPLVNAPVYLADAKDGCYIAAGLTGEKGEFCFFNLLTGEYRLKVEHDGTVKCDERMQLKIDSDGLQINLTAKLDNRKMVTTISGNRPAVHLNPLGRGISFDPNPSIDGKLNLISTEAFKRLKLEISDLSGWIVMTMDLDEVQAGYRDAFDLGNLEKGTYILEISTNRDRLSKQLILQ